MRDATFWDGSTPEEEARGGSYSVGIRRRTEIRRLFEKHRPDVAPEDVEAYLDQLDGYNNPKKEKLAVHWLIAGSIELPQDEFKLDKAIVTAERAKVDPFAYANPEEIFVAFPQHLPKDKAIDPDTVPELFNRTERGQGIVTYEVSEEIVGDRRRAGQLAMRRIINSHWGKDASPWCLLQGDENGELTESSRGYWEHYNSLPKLVAFKDGKLLAFMATHYEEEPDYDWDAAQDEYNVYKADCEERGDDPLPFGAWLDDRFTRDGMKKSGPVPEEWWDRMDSNHPGIPFDGKIEGDPLGRSGSLELMPDGRVERRGRLWRGNKTNGVYEEWLDEDTLLTHVEHKNGKLHGKVVRYWEDGSLKERGDYLDNYPVGLHRLYDRDGVVSTVNEYDHKGRRIAPEMFFHRGQLTSYRLYDKEGRPGDLYQFYPDGRVKAVYRYDFGTASAREYATFYQDGKTDGVYFTREDGVKVRLNQLKNSAYASADFTRPDGSGILVRFGQHDVIRSYSIYGEDGETVTGASWLPDGTLNEMVYNGHTLRFRPDGTKWDLRMPPKGSDVPYGEREAYTDEELKAVPDPVQPSLDELEAEYRILRGLRKMSEDFAWKMEKEAKRLFERETLNAGSYSVALKAAKRRSSRKRGGAVSQMEFDLFAVEKGIVERAVVAPEKPVERVIPKKYNPALEEAIDRLTAYIGPMMADRSVVEFNVEQAMSGNCDSLFLETAIDCLGEKHPLVEAIKIANGVGPVIDVEVEGVPQLPAEGIVPQPVEEPEPQVSTEPPKKGRRYQLAVDEAQAYQAFIDAYRPLFEAAVERGEWKAALDYAESEGMPYASNVLKQYFREPSFEGKELAGLKIAGPEDVVAILMTVRSPFVESTKAIYLDRHRRILDAKILSIGQAGQAMLAKGALTRNMPPKTAYVVFSHNHPSGDPKASNQDKDLTMALKKELKYSNVKLLDHIITDGDSYYSFNYQDVRPIDAKTPKWEVLPAKTRKNATIRSVSGLVSYVAAHLRDDGGSGHVIYFSRQLSIVGVRRVPALPEKAGADACSEWAKKVADAAENVGAASVVVDFGPVKLAQKDAKEVLLAIGPAFGVRGLDVTDAVFGAGGAGLRSIRSMLPGDWQALAPAAEPVDNIDRFDYPRYSIATRGIDWNDIPETASLDQVFTSTTVAHLTGQDRFPERYLLFKKLFRDTGRLELGRKTVEEWAKRPESKWFGKYLLAKYYGDVESALEVARHHLKREVIDRLGKSLDMGRPIVWVYVKNNDGRRTNRLPQAYATLLKASYLGGEVDHQIQKVSDERNTGASLKSRAGRDFQFAGHVRTKDDPQYVIVDDVWTTGQTSVSLMEYIMNEGGEVAAVTTLAVASNGMRIVPTESQLQSVLEKAKLSSVERALELTGVDLRKATGSELQAYIVKGSRGPQGLMSWFGDVAPTLPLDFSAAEKRRGGVGDADAPSGSPAGTGLFALLTDVRRKKTAAKPVQGVFRFSTAFPRLAEMDDDTLIAAALASRLALDRKDRMQNALKFDTIRKMVTTAHPTADDDEVRSRALAVQGETLKLARRIREGLDRGVSESAIMKALNDSMKPRFETEMRKEGREGAKIGAYGASAEAMLQARGERIFGEAVRVQAGVDSDLFEAWAGIDLVETLWKVLENAKADWRPVRKDEPPEGEEADGESAGTGGEAGRDPAAYRAEELENPRRFAEYIRDLAAKYWREKHSLPVGANPWSNQIAVQFLRKTAANVYTKLVNAITYSRSRDTAYRAIQKFDSIPTAEGLVSQMAFVGEIIHARHIREKRQELCEKLDTLLKTRFGATGRFKPDREELKRRVSAEMELRARYMRHAMWLTPEAASEEGGELSRALTAMATDYDEAGRDLEQSRVYVETIRKLNILREFGALKYKTVGEIEKALAYWQDLADGSSEKIVEAFEVREARTKAAAEILARAVANPKRKHAVERGPALAVNNYLTAHMGFASIIQDMMRFASDADRAEGEKILEYLAREIQKAGDRSAAEARRHGEAFHAAVTAIYGKSFKKALADLNREDPAFEPFMGTKGGKRITPTKARAMQLMVSLLQGAKKGSNYYDNVKEHKREGQAERIAALLTPQDMNLVKWIGQWYEANRAELSGVCESLFGIGVYSEAANYFPVKMLLPKQGLEKVEGVAWTIFPKALTPRVRNLRDFDTEADILSMWSARMGEAVQWKSHAKLGLELRGIFGRSVLQEAIIANHGSRVNSLVLGFVTDILAGHGAYDRTTGGIEYFSDQIRGWTALCALGGNLGVTFKQTTSIPAFGFEIGLVNTARYTVSAFTPAGMEAMKRIFDSEQRKTRWQVGNTEAVKNALAKNDAGLIKRMMQASMITNKIGDVVPGLVVGQGIYRDCLAKGMSEENAMAQTWMLIERTQQSGRMENQTSVQRRNRLGRMLYQFLSTQQQYLQYELRAARRMIADPSLENAGKLANTLLLNHFILSSLYYWMGELYKAMLGSEPPEEQLADWMVTCLLGPYGSLYVAGFCCQVTLDRFLKGDWAGRGNDIMPMESFIKNLIGDSARVIEAVLDEDKTTDDLIEELARLAASLNPIVRDVRRVQKNLEE